VAFRIEIGQRVAEPEDGRADILEAREGIARVVQADPLAETGPVAREVGDGVVPVSFDPTPPPCDGDADGNGVVDVNDITFIIPLLGTSCL